MCKKIIFILAMLVIAMPASAVMITYVDADIPVSGNSSPATNDALGNDDLWRLRTVFANGGTIYESGGSYGDTSNPEDCLRLQTRVSVPGNELGYDVYVYLWSDGSGWRVQASLTNDKPDMPLYIAGQAGTSNFMVQDGSTHYSDELSPNPFTTAVMITEGNRELWQAYIGTALVGTDPGQNYMLRVYIDDDPAHMTHNSRTWYDGIGYSAVVPEPATIALLGLGGLALLRKKRA